MEKRNIKIQPIAGKFCSATSKGRVIRIWLVDPKTNEQGTEVSYDDAMELLSLRHPMFCLSQAKGPDGQYIEKLTDEEWEYIDKRRLENLNKIAGNTLQPSEKKEPESDSMLKQLVETQAELIKNQNNQLAEQANQLAEMQNQMKAMQDSIAKLAKKTK